MKLGETVEQILTRFAGQGFEPDRILALLRTRRARRSNHEGHAEHEEQD